MSENATSFIENELMKDVVFFKMETSNQMRT